MIDTRISLEELNSRNTNNLVQNLGIEFIEINQDFLKARMPVDHRTIQPLGILSGGASAALAETVGSVAAYLSVDRSKCYILGIEIKCNHIKSTSGPFVYGIAKPLHTGKTTHVWTIEITDEEDKLICFSTHTMAVVELTDEIKVKFKDLFFTV